MEGTQFWWMLFKFDFLWLDSYYKSKIINNHRRLHFIPGGHIHFNHFSLFNLHQTGRRSVLTCLMIFFLLFKKLPGREQMFVFFISTIQQLLLSKCCSCGKHLVAKLFYSKLKMSCKCFLIIEIKVCI